MLVRSRLRNMLALAGGLIAATSCATGGAQTPAVLSSSDAAAMAALKSALATAMNAPSVELGPGDPAQNSTVSVLPPRPGPYEGRSTAMPTLFDIVMRGDACFVVRRDSGEAFPLAGVSCRAVNP